MITDRRETLKCRTEVVGSFKMSSSARLRSPGKLAIAITLIAIAAVGLGCSYYFVPSNVEREAAQHQVHSDTGLWKRSGLLHVQSICFARHPASLLKSA